MRIIISILIIICGLFQGIALFADSSDYSVQIQGYNDIAKQYNEASSDRTAWKKRVLTNLRVYVNRVLSRSDRLELKKKGYLLRTSPINGTIPLLSTGEISPVVQGNSNKITPQVIKNGNLTIKESSYTRISEEFNFIVYEAEVTASGGDVTLRQIDFVQDGTGDGINIGEIYKLDYGNNLFQLSNNRDSRIFKYYKRDGNSGISFDLYTGTNPGMLIKNGETVKFQVRIDTNTLPNFTQGKLFQRTNIFFAKFKIKGKEGYYDHTISRGVFYVEPENNYYISGNTPQILVYNVCDNGVKFASGSELIVFDEYLQRNRFTGLSEEYIAQQTRIGATPTDYTGYRIFISNNRGSNLSYNDWLKEKYLSGIIQSYTDSSSPWLFLGYKSKITNQFVPVNGMQCKDIEDVAKLERVQFKQTYDELKTNDYQKKVDQLTDRVSELEALNAGCTIKGNVNFDTGEKIYHLPGSRFYSETVINTLYGERWFCSESDAINAGWRKEQGY